MQVVMLIIGTVLLVLLTIKTIKGKSFENYVKNLDSSEFPAKIFCSIGFAWNEGKLLKLRGKPREMLMSQAKLLYDPQYAEYYATVAWTQAIGLVHVLVCAGAVLAGAFNFPFFMFVGVLFGAVLGYYLIGRMKEQLEQRKIECTVQLPEIVSTMALLINSGMVLKEAWEKVAYAREGVVYSLMRDACTDMQNGMSEADAIHKFGVMSNSPDIKKFTGALIQGIEMGSKDLSNFLTLQSTEMWVLKKQVMLQKGEAAATKLLMPITLIFVGIIVIVISAAAGMLI